MANTTNFGWETPDDTDLVKDGAAAMRTLGNAIDTSLVDLKGGTTDQVLAKNSNTDMDFKWVTSDDANAIQNAIVDAKGDLIAASAADTPARLAVGNNGETLVADSSATTGLRWQGNFAAGKNKIINGDFEIWQRGTSFANPANFSYFADRFYSVSNNTGGTVTLSRQTFTPGTAPVAGYESQFYFRTVGSSPTGASFNTFGQRIEDVRTFAGQTMTLSFWAKADTARNVTPQLVQNFGSGGSTEVVTAGTAIALTTSWARYSQTFSVPSVSGKTIGTSSYFGIEISQPINVSHTIEYWGIQAEAGSVATAFQTATGTLAGELAACQRYYYRHVDGASQAIGVGYNESATSMGTHVKFPVTMRIAPVLVVSSGTAYYTFYRNSANDDFNSFTLGGVSANEASIYNNSEISGTAGHAGNCYSNNASASVAFNSEL